MIKIILIACQSLIHACRDYQCAGVYWLNCIFNSYLANILGAVKRPRLCFPFQTPATIHSQTSTEWLLGESLPLCYEYQWTYVLQLEREFRPTRLGNWEVPKWLPQRPRARKTTTRIIANDRGHLLPGVSRPPQNPWGAYRGTWQLPNKISRNFGTPTFVPRMYSTGVVESPENYNPWGQNCLWWVQGEMKVGDL